MSYRHKNSNTKRNNNTNHVITQPPPPATSSESAVVSNRNSSTVRPLLASPSSLLFDENVVRKSYSMPMSSTNNNRTSPAATATADTATTTPSTIHETKLPTPTTAAAAAAAARTIHASQNPSVVSSVGDVVTTTTTAGVDQQQRLVGSSKAPTIYHHHPYYKLDRYGFIVNMDLQGNVISSSSSSLSLQQPHVRNGTPAGTTGPDPSSPPPPLRPVTIRHGNGQQQASSSNYSIDTNYDRPSAATVVSLEEATTTKPFTDDTGNGLQPPPPPLQPPSTKQQRRINNNTSNKKNYYMQRRRKTPVSTEESTRTARRVVKWDTMLKYNIPMEVVATTAVIPQQQMPKIRRFQRRPRPSPPTPLPGVVVPAVPQSSTTSTSTPPSLFHFQRNHRRYVIMKRRLRKGIPNQHQRSIIWPILCHVQQLKQQQPPNLYHSLLLQITTNFQNHDHLDAVAAAATTTTSGGISPATASTATTSTTGCGVGSINGIGSDSTTLNNKNNNSNDVEDTTTIELNYTKKQSTRATTTATDNNKISSLSSSPPPIQFQYTKSFHSIQETIERDLHRTFPRHCMFYTTAEENDDDDIDNDNNVGNSNLSPSRPHQDTAATTGSNNAWNHLKLLVRDSMMQPDYDPDQLISSETQDIQQQQQQNSSICGTNEISNLIRELDLVPQMGTAMKTTATTTATKPRLVVDVVDDRNLMDPTCGATFTTIADDDDDDPKPDHGNKNIRPDTDTTTNPSVLMMSPTIPPDQHLQHYNTLMDGVDGQSRLRRVLKAYSVYDREIGYCQGMNFIAAMFLTLVQEEDAFWMLVAVMQNSPCRMRGLYGEGMRETHQALFVTEKLIQQFLPKLSKHFEKESIHVTMFATQWLLTQFTSSFRFDLVTRLWDSFLFEGWKTTYRVMLAVLQRSQSDLLSLSFEDILAYFRELPDRPDIDGSIVDDSMKIPLKTSHIRKYEMEWRSEQQHH